MLNRLKRLWALSRKDPQTLDKLAQVPKEVLDQVPEAGDGKAVFLSEGSEEEYKEFEKEQSGLAAWYKRLRNL